jgi:FkbM family methyltransferase
MNKLQKERLKKLADLIIKQQKLSFVIANIGCRPNDGDTPEPFEIVLEYFPGSEILGFELDKELCKKLNKESKKGFKFFHQALGNKNESRKLYNTMDPMCSSFYKPNEKFIEKYQDLNMMYLKNISEIDTISLDHFCLENKIEKIDFIKIDIQGAELDVFKGAKNTLKNTLCIISEVEFVPFYINQPLFGDVHNFLIAEDFMLVKFLGIGGRYMKPTLLDNKVTGSLNQHLWADVFFSRNIESIKKLDDEKILKLSFFAFLHYNPDITVFFLSEYDLRNGTNLKKSFLDNIN